MTLKERMKDVDPAIYYGYTLCVQYISRDGIEDWDNENMSQEIINKYGEKEIASEIYSDRDYYLLTINIIV